MPGNVTAAALPAPFDPFRACVGDLIGRLLPSVVSRMLVARAVLSRLRRRPAAVAAPIPFALAQRAQELVQAAPHKSSTRQAAVPVAPSEPQ